MAVPIILNFNRIAHENEKRRPSGVPFQIFVGLTANLPGKQPPVLRDELLREIASFI
jgi:hypothetical protein